MMIADWKPQGHFVKNIFWEIFRSQRMIFSFIPASGNWWSWSTFLV